MVVFPSFTLIIPSLSCCAHCSAFPVLGLSGARQLKRRWSGETLVGVSVASHICHPVSDMAFTELCLSGAAYPYDGFTEQPPCKFFLFLTSTWNATHINLHLFCQTLHTTVGWRYKTAGQIALCGSSVYHLVESND